MPDVRRASGAGDRSRTRSASWPSPRCTAAGLESLKEEIYRVVDIIRVYTKIPGRKPDLHAPFVLPAGSTVMDLARMIHRDFAEGLRFARIWGSGKFDGQSVQRDHVLENGDVIELHI